MKLRVLGFSPPYPNPGEATSAYLLETRCGSVLLDCGHGAVGVLLEVMDPGDLAAVVISHMHPDHFYDLIPLRNALFHGARREIPVYVPAGGREMLRELVAATRLPEDYLDGLLAIHEYSVDAPPSALETLEIELCQTVHPILTWAFRFCEDGKALVYTSDTAWSQAIIDFAYGADLLVVEATDHGECDGARPERWHLTPREAGRLSRDTCSLQTVLTHYVSSHADAIRSAAILEHGDGDIRLARRHDEYMV